MYIMYNITFITRYIKTTFVLRKTNQIKRQHCCPGIKNRVTPKSNVAIRTIIIGRNYHTM